MNEIEAHDEPVLEISDLHKDYRALRPLRIRRLIVRRGEVVALVGFDEMTAELFVNLATGATLPDAGEVRAFGTLSSAIEDPDEWLSSLDRFGLVSERAVLLDHLTAGQNLAVPLTLELQPLPSAIQERVDGLADEVGLTRERLLSPAGELTPFDRALLRFARAIALDPKLVLAEHPNAFVPQGSSRLFAARMSGVLTRRRIAGVVLTADHKFASDVAGRVLTLNPATGELHEPKGWRAWLNR